MVSPNVQYMVLVLILNDINYLNYQSKVDFNNQRDITPLFSTVLMHFSTKLGTLVFSWLQRLCKWHPNTFSVGKGSKDHITIIFHPKSSVKVAGNGWGKAAVDLWYIPCLWPTAGWAAWGETSSVWCGPSSDLLQMLKWMKDDEMLTNRKRQYIFTLISIFCSKWFFLASLVLW